MNDNWWVMQQMIEARQRELRRAVERTRPWAAVKKGSALSTVKGATRPSGGRPGGAVVHSGTG